MTHQKLNTFSGGYVQAQQNSNLQVGPGVYSLSSRCNLPYVEFLSAGGYQKTISWGEYAEVPCNELVTVRNASFHPGNLIINAGLDPFPPPARITVPTPLVTVGDGGKTKYRLDTRRAKRAYLMCNMRGDGDGDFVANVVGYSLTTHDTVNGINNALNPGVGYVAGAYNYIGPVNHIIVPLGFAATLGDDSRPMALLDSAEVTFDTQIPTEGPPTAYFVAEYL